MLELRNIKKHYNSNLVLEISSLQLKSGIYWVKGTNGSGKTTLLKIIAGLLPFEGDIVVDGISLKDKSILYRQSVSWAEAEPLYPPFMSGSDLISFYCNIRKVSQKEAEILVELVGMSGYVNNAVGTYSTGMTKKLSLVLAFIGNPSLIVLDEPLITLDADALIAACTFIFEKHRSSGTSFIMSSHQELDAALSLSGKALIVSNKSVAVE